MSLIAVNKPLFEGNELLYLKECIESGWISSDGPFVEKFEAAMAKQLDRRNAIAVTSGTAALQIAIETLELRNGDEVILPTFCIISCILPIIRSGANAVLVDSDPHTWNMNIEEIERKITTRTRAILAVHTYGLPLDMHPLEALAIKYGITLIEDAAEALGAKCLDRPCGNFGKMSVLSFYANKVVTTGEGGMILTDDQELANRCRSLRNLCFEKERRFVHHQLGHNFRISNLQAAVGLAQQEKLDTATARKKEIGLRYLSLLQECAGLKFAPAKTSYSENVYWVFGVLLDESVNLNAQAVMQLLSKEGIQTRPFFYPMHAQPIFKAKPFAKQNFPIADLLAERGFYLPSGIATSNEEIENVAAALKRIMVNI